MHTFTRPAVEAGSKTLPARWYLSPEVYAAERERIFARSWICVGREGRVAEPGDFFLAAPAGESLIVTRDRSGAIHAFYNVCRHRGTRLCERESGRFQGSIQCSYHAWTYALDGSLKVARNMADVPGFETSEYPLQEAAVALWEGFIFVNLDPQAAPFERALAPIVGRFADWDVANLHVAREVEYDVACNWKLIFQNYSECYHCPLVHPQLDKLSPSDSGRNDLLEGPVLGGYSEMRSPGGSLTTTGHLTRPPLGSVSGANVDRSYYYTIFPSLLFSLHADYVMVHYVEPAGVARTRITCAWLFDPETMATCEFDAKDAVDFWDLTNRQDWHVSELTQQGLRSRAYSPGPYSNAEGLLAAFDRYYLSAMDAR